MKCELCNTDEEELPISKYGKYPHQLLCDDCVFNLMDAKDYLSTLLDFNRWVLWGTK